MKMTKLISHLLRYKIFHVALYVALQKSFFEGIPIIPVVTSILVNQEGYTTDRQ